MAVQDERLVRYEQGRRLGRGPFLLVWTLLLPVPYVLGATASSGAPAALAGAVIGIALVAAARVAVAVARLRDLGRPPSQAFWGVIPGGDLVSLFLLGGATPSTDARHKRVRSWITQVGPFEAYGRAAAWLGPSAAIGLATATFGALVQGAGGELFRDTVVDRASGGEAGGLDSVLGGTAVLLGAYVLLQLPKRHRASRASWLPALLLLPTLVALAAFEVVPMVGQGAGAALLMLFEIAWTMAVGSLVGGLAAACWIVSAVALHEGRRPSLGQVVGEASRHFADVVVAWGTRNQIVQLGLQVVVPGIWYAISFAFSDIVVVVHPDRPMLAGSTQLTRGIRSKIFTMLAVAALAQLTIATGAQLLFLDPQRAFAALFDPSIVPLPAVLVGDFVGWLVAWWSTLALVVVFFERDGLLAAKREREAGAAGPSGP